MNSGWKLSSMTQKDTLFLLDGNCYILRNIFCRKIDLRFLWAAPYMMTTLPATIHILKGRIFRFIYFRLFFFSFYLFKLGPLLPQQVHKASARASKTWLAGTVQRKWKNMFCNLLGYYSSWPLVLLANTQFTKSWEIWVTIERIEDLQANCKRQSLIVFEQCKKKKKRKKTFLLPFQQEFFPLAHALLKRYQQTVPEQIMMLLHGL